MIKKQMSDAKVLQFSFLWKIHNFSYVFDKNAERLTSPTLTVGNFGASRWHLVLYLNGYQKDSSDFISLYLSRAQDGFSSQEIAVCYALEMKGGDGELLKMARSGRRVFKENSCFGWNKFVRRSKVFNGMELWDEDVLTMRCYMYYERNQTKLLTKEVFTDITITKKSFLWNVKLPQTSGIVRKDFSLSKNSLYHTILMVIDEEIKIIFYQMFAEKSKIVNFKISLLSSEGNDIISKSTRFHFQDNSFKRFEFPSLISKSFLQSNKEAFVERDTISLLYKFTISDGTIEDEVPNLSCDLYSRQVLFEELKRLSLNSEHFDVQLKTIEGSLQAHKSILATRSPVFAAMFRQDMIESQTNIVEIPDVEERTLKIFLEFIYTGKVDDLDFESAKKLVLVANKYHVLTLVENTVSVMESVLSVGNVCEILLLADIIGHSRLRKSAMKFIHTHFKVMINLPEWANFSKNNAGLVSEMIQLMHERL